MSVAKIILVILGSMVASDMVSDPSNMASDAASKVTSDLISDFASNFASNLTSNLASDLSSDGTADLPKGIYIRFALNFHIDGMNKIFPLVYNKNLDNFTSELENISRAWKKIQKMINVGPLNRAVGLGKKIKIN